MTEKKIVNGINVEQLFKAIEAFKQQPELAKFKFRATNQWAGGTHSGRPSKISTVRGRRIHPGKPQFLTWDEPPVLLGNNLGTNPVEYLLVALSGCLTTLL